MSNLSEQDRLILAGAGFTDREISLYRQKFYNLLNTAACVPKHELTACEERDDIKRTANDLIHNFDAAIRRIASELTGLACGGVDTGNNINPETNEPYGPGGHTGWLLASEAKKLREERDRYKAALDWLIDNGMTGKDIGFALLQKDCPEHLRKRLEGSK